MYDVYILVDPHFYGDLIVFIGYPKTSAVCFNNRLGPGRPWMPHCFNGQTLRPGRWMDDSIPIGSMGLGMLVYPPWNINSQFRTWKIWKWMVGILNSFLFGKAHSISKTTVPYSWIYNIIYIYICQGSYIRPLYMFLILGLNPPKEGPNSNQNSGSFGFQVASVSKTIIPYIIPWLLY